ncbi:MAG: ABC transporter permease, partial [Asgard group archaeon]|nr:ABC transporter permease [Asgard group archaeon]
MEEIYNRLTEYKKEHSWKNRFGSIYRIYLSKLWSLMVKDKRSWIFEALMLLPILAGPIVAIAQPGMLFEEFYSIYSDVMFMGYIGIIVPLFTMYIAITLFSDEKSDKTITYMTVRPIKSLELVGVKYLSYLTIVPIFTIISSGLIYLSFGVFGRFMYFSAAIRYLLGATLASAVYGAFFMFIGLVFKRPLIFGLFFAFIWEFVFASFSQTLRSLTIAFYIKSFLVWSPTDGESPILLEDTRASAFNFLSSPAKPVTFSIVLALIIIVSITLSWAAIQGATFKIPYQAGKRAGGWKYYLKEIRSFLIAIGIVFLAIGVAFGPITGIKKDSTSAVNHNIEVGTYPGFTGDNPSMTDMGYGDYYKLILSKGDQVDLQFILSQAYPSENYTIKAIVCTETDYEQFVEDTQEIWLEYRDNYDSGEFDTYYFENLMAQYETIVNNFITTSAIKEANVNNQIISLEANSRSTYMICVLTTSFNYSQNNFFYASIDMIMDGTFYRRYGYGIGWGIVCLGAISLGFSIYSFITYSSEDEIQRYNEHKERYKDI